MERVELRIPDALSMLPDSERGAFSRAIASSAKQRVAILEKKARQARAVLQKFEDRYGRTYPDSERGFPERRRRGKP